MTTQIQLFGFDLYQLNLVKECWDSMLRLPVSNIEIPTGLDIIEAVDGVVRFYIEDDLSDLFYRNMYENTPLYSLPDKSLIQKDPLGDPQYLYAKLIRNILDRDFYLRNKTIRFKWEDFYKYPGKTYNLLSHYGFQLEIKNQMESVPIILKSKRWDRDLKRTDFRKKIEWVLGDIILGKVQNELRLDF